jgi:glycosyltransferase involved in cell wall biosynthesis
MVESEPPRREAETPWAKEGPCPPTVSVVIPCFNSQDLIAGTIASVAAQTLASVEIIVVDDASTDATVEVARQALEQSGREGRLVRCLANGGPAQARNEGVRRARGEFVAFLDSDDSWMPEKLERQVALMRADPHVTLCACQAIWVDEETGRQWPLFRDLPTFSRDGWRRLLWQTYVATPCVMARRDDLGTAPFDVRLRVAEDRDLWFKLASNGTVALVQEPMVRIRVSRRSYMAQHVRLIRDHTVPMIRRNMASFAEVLTLRERMLALGRLHAELGRSMVDSPAPWPRGALHLVWAAMLGDRPMDNLTKVLATAPCLGSTLAALRRWRRRPTPAGAPQGPPA